MNIFYDGFWLDYWNEVLNILCSSILSGKWWKDYGIPLLGSILIPTSVWYFGSVRAEKQKELKELRDNLNLLISVCFASIYKLIVLKNTINRAHIFEEKALKNITFLRDISSEEQDTIFVQYCPLSEFNVIDFAKYSDCVSYKPDFLLNLIEMKNSLDIINFRISGKNEELGKIAHCENKQMQFEMFSSLMNLEVKKHNEYIEKIDITILLLKAIISDAKNLEKHKKGLNLRDITYTPEYQEIFNNIELNLKPKEQENDK